MVDCTLGVRKSSFYSPALPAKFIREVCNPMLRLQLWLRLLLPSLALAFLTACGGGALGNSNSGSVRLVSLSITPASLSLAKGKSQQVTAQAAFSDGSTKDVTTSATWSSSSAAVATVGNSSGARGMVKALAVGSSTISASLPGTDAGTTVTGSAALSVSAATVESIAVAPGTSSVALGLKQQFTATGTYSDSTTRDITASATWTSSDATVATVAGGQATSLKPGSASIKAVLGSVSGAAALTVAPPALLSISVAPPSASVPKGSTLQFTAQGTYTDGTTANVTNSVTWTATAGASISTFGFATGSAVSTSTITAKSGSISGTALLTVQPAALVSLAVSPKTASIARSTTQQFTASGKYTDGTTQDLTASATWSASSGATVVKGLATATAAGSVTVTATAGSFSSDASLKVTLPAVTSITISPASISVGLGASQQYTAIATYADLVQSDVTTSVAWHSENTSVANISNAGMANVVATSSTAVAITAELGGITSNTAFLSALASMPRVCPSPTIDMKLLVITNGQTEADFPAITQILDYVGTPYTVFDMATQAGGISAAMLSDGACHGYYQGVIFANGGYIYSLPGMATLNSYEVTFKARQVNWFTFPGPDFGLTYTGTSINPGTNYTADFTTAAAPVFAYANTATPLTIANATVYLAAPASGSVTPLLTDGSGNVVSAIYTLSDGREYLTQTFDSNQYLTHDLVLAYGLLNWVTKGVFLGEYHVYVSPQVDDVFINDTNWEADTPCIDPASPTGDRTDPDSSSLGTFRLAAGDIDALLAWMNLKQQNPLFSNFVLHLAFNGAGTTGRTSTGGYRNDTLTPELEKYQASFKWISHTWDHPDTLDGQTASFIDSEIQPNNQQAISLGLTYYNPANMVTPGVTGLNDATFVNQAVTDGIKYVVTDTSVLNTPNNGPNPSPNVGLVNTINAGLYMVPRHANNLFFNVSQPDGWTAEYQCIYSGQAPYSTYSYQQILDNISQTFVADMLKGDMDPEMFHQPNLRAYDGTHSLIGDLYDETFTAYQSLFNLPVLSPTLDQLALSMQARDQYNKSGATASLVAGSSIKVTVPAGAAVTSAAIPVTGLYSAGAEVYGGQNISHVTVNAGQTVTLPVE